MLDLCLLGTGGMMPLPYRWLTSLMLRYNGNGLLIDCGEGTQIAIERDGTSDRLILSALPIYGRPYQQPAGYPASYEAPDRTETVDHDRAEGS